MASPWGIGANILLLRPARRAGTAGRSRDRRRLGRAGCRYSLRRARVPVTLHEAERRPRHCSLHKADSLAARLLGTHHSPFGSTLSAHAIQWIPPISDKGSMQAPGISVGLSSSSVNGNRKLISCRQGGFYERSQHFLDCGGCVVAVVSSCEEGAGAASAVGQASAVYAVARTRVEHPCRGS
jgi:hypothetical protein